MRDTGHSGNLMVADALRLPFKNHCFDLVYAFDVLNYMSDPTAAIKEVDRVLRPGGRVVFGIVNSRSLAVVKTKLAAALLRYSRAWDVTETELLNCQARLPYTSSFYSTAQIHSLMSPFDRVTQSCHMVPNSFPISVLSSFQIALSHAATSFYRTIRVRRRRWGGGIADRAETIRRYFLKTILKVIPIKLFLSLVAHLCAPLLARFMGEIILIQARKNTR